MNRLIFQSFSFTDIVISAKSKVFHRCYDFSYRIWSGAEVCKPCGSRKMLQNEYLIAKIGFDRIENKPSKFCKIGKTPVLRWLSAADGEETFRSKIPANFFTGPRSDFSRCSCILPDCRIPTLGLEEEASF